MTLLFRALSTSYLMGGWADNCPEPTDVGTFIPQNALHTELPSVQCALTNILPAAGKHDLHF